MKYGTPTLSDTRRKLVHTAGTKSANQCENKNNIKFGRKTSNIMKVSKLTFCNNAYN